MLCIDVTANRETVRVSGCRYGPHDGGVEASARVREMCGADAEPALQFQSRALDFLRNTLRWFIRQERMTARMRADRHAGVTHLRQHLPGEGLESLPHGLIDRRERAEDVRHALHLGVREMLQQETRRRKTIRCSRRHTVFKAG